MKSVIKIYQDDAADFYNWLKEIPELEINTEIVDWRVMMWRKKDEKQWTQAYAGLTRKAKAERDFLRVFGPDEDLVIQFYNKD